MALDKRPFLLLGAIYVKISNQQSLIFSSSASYTLNYLVFLQNVFLNQQAAPNEPLRFPYLNSSHWGLLDGDVFQEKFKNTFEYVIEHFSHHQSRAQELILTNRQDELFRCLFEPSQIGMQGLEESFLSFITWWKHGAGGSYVSTRLNETSLGAIYNQLNTQVETASVEQRVLKIDLVYDEIQFSDETIRKNYVVLPIQEIEKLPYTKTLPDTVLRKFLFALNY